MNLFIRCLAFLVSLILVAVISNSMRTQHGDFIYIITAAQILIAGKYIGDIGADVFARIKVNFRNGRG